jgi:hypothetical protein
MRSFDGIVVIEQEVRKLLNNIGGKLNEKES